MTQGVLYISTSEPYVEECVISALSVKKYMPDISTALISDVQPPDNTFTHYVPIDNPKFGFYDRVKLIKNTPFERTLFLDSDTYVCGDLSEVFDLLDEFDIAAAHAPVRRAINKFLEKSDGSPANPQNLEIMSIPLSFPELNCGVIAFRKTPKVIQFFDDWLTLYEKHCRTYKSGYLTSDQVSFCSTLYRSGLRMAVLPPEYNCRFIFPVFVHSKVKILHGRHPDIESLEQRLNANLGNRIYIPNGDIVLHGTQQITQNRNNDK